MELIQDKSTRELAERLYELAKDMDYMDYEDTKEDDIRCLDYAIATVFGLAQYNDEIRVLYNVLQRI